MFEDDEYDPEVYQGPDCIEKFTARLKELYKEFYPKLSKVTTPEPMTDEIKFL